MKERKKYIDVAKFVSIFLLYIDHTGLFLDLSGRGYSILKIWICSFHMPMFFVTFGIVASTESVGQDEFFRVVNKRFGSLIVPYLIWSAFYASSLDIKFIVGTLYGTNYSLGYASTNQVLWFLPVMFCATIIFQVCINIRYIFGKYKQEIICIVEMCICGMISLLLKIIRPSMGIFFGIDIAFTGTVFMLIGVLLRPFIGKIYCMSKKNIISLAMVFITIGFIISQYNVPKEICVTTMALAYYGRSYSLFLINEVISVIGIVCMSILMENIRIFSWLGENSMLLMSLHFLLFDYTIQIATNVVSNNGLIISIVNAVICIAFSIPIILFINKYAPLLKGK